MSANQTQIGGDHYKQNAIQPWDFIVQNNFGFLEGNVIKYLSRWRLKGGVDDLLKASHYLQKIIETNTTQPTISAEVQQLQPNAPWGLKKDGTPKSRPGRRPGQKNKRSKK